MTSRTSRTSCLVTGIAALFIMTVAPAGPARADQPSPEDDQKARELFRIGETHYAAGRYDKAALLYEEAYRLSGRAEILLALVNSHERMGDYAQAIVYLRQYLDHPRARNVESLRDRLQRLEQAQRERDEERVRVRELEKAEQARAEAERQRQQSQTIAPPGDGKDRRDAAPRGPSRLTSYLLLGGGAAGVAGAVGFGIASRRAGDDAAGQCGDGQLCRASAKSALARELRYSVLADVSAALGVGAAVVGAYLLFSKPGGEPIDQRSAVRLAPTALPGGGGVVLVGDF